MPIPLTLVITTYNRERFLLQCLGSLLAQDHQPHELIIIDNNSTDHTKHRCLLLAENTGWRVRYVYERKQVYPAIYNRGIREAKTEWVAFIDDDCIAEPGWFAAALKALQKYPQAVALVGQSGTMCQQNWWSVLQLSADGIWKYLGRDGSRITDFETLDNKNIMYNKKLLMSHNIVFDERLSPWWLGSSEDCDLGKQIEKAGLQARYIPAMKVLHTDPTSGSWYFKKLFQTTISHVPFLVKWHGFRNNKRYQNQVLKRSGFWEKLQKIQDFHHFYHQLYGISLFKLRLAWFTHSALQRFLVQPFQKIVFYYYRTQITESLSKITN